MKKLYMGTTKIDPQKTVGEIMQVLVASGARQIATEYDGRGEVTGLRFSINAAGQDLAFALPVRPDPLLKYLRGDKQQAARVAWRQLLRWCQAQLAMIEVGMVSAHEVYIPYMLAAGTEQTLFQVMTESRFKAIAPPEAK